MKIIEKNVITGKVTERPYTQKELDAIAIETIASTNRKKDREKREDIEVKREAAIEELLMSGTTVKAKAYQNAIK